MPKSAKRASRLQNCPSAPLLPSLAGTVRRLPSLRRCFNGNVGGPGGALVDPCAKRLQLVLRERRELDTLVRRRHGQIGVVSGCAGEKRALPAAPRRDG